MDARNKGPRGPRRPTLSRRKRRLKGTSKAESILARRISELMAERDTNASALAKAAGLGSTAVYDLISGKSRTPMVDVVQAIANALDVDLAYVIGSSDHPRVQRETYPRLEIPVVGRAETGAWRVMPITTVVERDPLLPIRMIDGPRHARFPSAPHFALEIVDQSMNAAKPAALLPGMDVLCVDLIALKLPIESNKLYAVRVSDKAGEHHQTLIRRVVMQDGHFDLVPETTDSRYETLTFPGQLTTDPAAPVCAFGLIYRLEIDLD